jgi:hypothetical protein
MALTKEHIHALVDRLPDSELAAVERVLDDPLLRSLLSTPPDDEPLSVEEIAGILEAKREAQAGRVRGFDTADELISDLNANSQH